MIIILCILNGFNVLSIQNENGGIVDDTVITNAGDYVYMVVNGACKVSFSFSLDGVAILYNNVLMSKKLKWPCL